MKVLVLFLVLAVVATASENTVNTNSIHCNQFINAVKGAFFSWSYGLWRLKDGEKFLDVNREIEKVRGIRNIGNMISYHPHKDGSVSRTFLHGMPGPQRELVGDVFYLEGKNDKGEAGFYVFTRGMTYFYPFRPENMTFEKGFIEAGEVAGEEIRQYLLRLDLPERTVMLSRRAKFVNGVETTTRVYGTEPFQVDPDRPSVNDKTFLEYDKRYKKPVAGGEYLTPESQKLLANDVGGQFKNLSQFFSKLDVTGKENELISGISNELVRGNGKLGGELKPWLDACEAIPMDGVKEAVSVMRTKLTPAASSEVTGAKSEENHAE